MKKTDQHGSLPSQEEKIEEVAKQLREALRPVLRAAAGEDPRPMKLARAIDIDKSLASVLVRAVKAKSDRDLLHIVPSPTGLRILTQRTKGIASRTATARLESATDRFRRLLESIPGGRAALDARIAESSRELGWKREHTSKQATFKSLSFLLGYYCDVMSSSMFLVPSESDPSVADAIEVTRRVGVRRMRSTATIPLFSFTPWAGEGPDRVGPVVPDTSGPNTSNILLADFCSSPMPDVEVVNEDTSFAVVLPGTPDAEPAMDFAWAFRHDHCHELSPEKDLQVLHAYFLHMPTRRVVRDLFISESFGPTTAPIITWALPGTRHYEHPPRDGVSNYYANVALDARYEPLDEAKRTHPIAGMPGHDRMVQSVLERAGHAKVRFRGWRCTLDYPVPLLDMVIWLKHR
jgi:hypothetical protein